VRYLLMVFEDPAEVARLTDAERAAIVPAHRAFAEELIEAGAFRAGDALEPVATATTVRVRGGRRTIADAPFAETAERLVGYYLIEVRDLDEAIAIAARVPSARFGAVEVRPVRRLRA